MVSKSGITGITFQIVLLLRRLLALRRWNILIEEYLGANGKLNVDSIAETAKANQLKPYEYFEYLLTEIPKHMDDKNNNFLEELLPWSETLPENIRKPKKMDEKMDEK